jgi:hypothetical protein
MKQFNFLKTLILSVSLPLLFFSCGSGDEKSTESATSDSTKVDSTTMKAPEPVPVAKISDILIVRHRVANYAKWKPGYDSDDSGRRANGLTNYIIGRGMDDSNMVVIVLKMDDANKAKEFGNSPGLKEKMQKAGVIGKPSVSAVHRVMTDSTPIEQNTRLMVTHQVKDWDTWKKVFDSHKSARMDAGLIDRGVGYSVDDNHIVTLVFAVTDKKKAEGFLKSKDLKDKMAEGGVVGQPTVFWYNVVQKY